MSELSKKEIFQMLYEGKRLTMWLFFWITWIFTCDSIVSFMKDQNISGTITTASAIGCLIAAILTYSSIRTIKKIITYYKKQEQWK